jgi:hypothetical protein
LCAKAIFGNFTREDIPAHPRSATERQGFDGRDLVSAYVQHCARRLQDTAYPMLIFDGDRMKLSHEAENTGPWLGRLN